MVPGPCGRPSRAGAGRCPAGSWLSPRPAKAFPRRRPGSGICRWRKGRRPPWGARIQAPDGEDGLPATEERLAEIAAAGPVLAAVYGGTPLTRILLVSTPGCGWACRPLIDPGLSRTRRSPAAVRARRPGRCPGRRSRGMGARMTSTAAEPQPRATGQAHQGGQTDRQRQGDLTALFAPPDRRGGRVPQPWQARRRHGAVLARFATGSRTLALVNGRDEEMYGSVGAAAADGAIDLAVICVPAPACPGVLAEAAAAGAGAAVICGGGFGETGGQGVVLQRELSAIVAGRGSGCSARIRAASSCRRPGWRRASYRARPRCGRGALPWSRPAAASTTRSRSGSPRPATGSAWRLDSATRRT